MLLHLPLADTFMSKTARLYRDTRTSSGLDRLNDDLQDVTRIMTKNMEELLWRGDSLDRESLDFPALSLATLACNKRRVWRAMTPHLFFPY